MPEYFVTRSGRRIAEPDTDQAASEALIRTVSRYTDGTAIDRPQPCVSIGYAGGPEKARALAETLDRRGYLPPARPMTRAEFGAAFPDPEARGQRMARALWSVLGEGLPAAEALSQHGLAATSRRTLRRRIKALGWD